MIKKQSRSEVRVKKHMKVRNRLSGTAERPRLAVFRSNNHMYEIGRASCRERV